MSLADDFNTPEVLRLMSVLVTEASRYLIEATENQKRALEPVLACTTYIVHIMSLFGVPIGDGLKRASSSSNLLKQEVNEEHKSETNTHIPK